MKVAGFLLGGCFVIAISTAALAAVPQSPRVGNVEILADQGWAGNPDLIWYDNFDSSQPLIDRYLETSSGGGTIEPISYEALGGTGQSVRGRWQQGQTSAGKLMKVFGRNPGDYRGLGVRKNEDFTEIYWRHYVKMQEGWIDNPFKLTMVTSFADSNWSQAMIAQVWEGTTSEGNPNTLGFDPTRGVNSASEVITTKFNDFDNFAWLGHKNASSTIFETAESGRWVSVEGHVKLNTTVGGGGAFGNGIFEVWIDGQLEIQTTSLNWVYEWDDYGINSAWLINYWNGGSPVAQERYFDDFVISTAPIGLAKSPLNPWVTKTSFGDSDTGDTQAAWQLQIASDLGGTDMVWDSGDILGAGLSIGVNSANGAFQGSLTGESRLMEEHLYALRVRQQDTNGEWSGWSPWNTSLQTAAIPEPSSCVLALVFASLAVVRGCRQRRIMAK